MTLYPAGGKFLSLIYKLAGKEKRPLVDLALGWKEIVGRILAERSSVTGLERKVLKVAVENNVWMQELILGKFRIIEAISQRFRIKLTDIVFYIR
ncbi:MAG: DUF721 domain-containing protein [Candidatus Cloacimonetes bacterium]|nr:DUF721 domain-containing protein [Candidatus Cloacimonadota bacterium]